MGGGTRDHKIRGDQIDGEDISHEADSAILRPFRGVLVGTKSHAHKQLSLETKDTSTGKEARYNRVGKGSSP